MKYNPLLFDLLDKYTTWAKFDWCCLVHSPITETMYIMDMEHNKKRTINYLIKTILDNGMLDECFTLEELSLLYIVAPKKFKKGIEYYL
jgi:hypothetical protein